MCIHIIYIYIHTYNIQEYMISIYIYIYTYAIHIYIYIYIYIFFTKYTYGEYIHAKCPGTQNRKRKAVLKEEADPWDPAEFFGLDVGSLDIGAQADIVLLDPLALQAWDSNDTRQLQYRELFEHNQMINRSDGVVTCVLINGETVWRDGEVTEMLGRQPLGRALRAA